jgi:YHS domain-containing protein
MKRAPLTIAALLSFATVVLGTVSDPAAAFSDTSPAAVNLDRAALALRGYDPVAYFTIGKPTPGKAEFTAVHEGATYRFASAEHRDAFGKEPAKYAPQYGGFCAWAAAQGYKADADPTAWKVVDGRLFVNYNVSVQRGWNADAAGLIKKADVKWSTIASKAPKDLQR